MAGLKVNFSDQEASSEARSFEPLPTGEYHVRITDLDDRECGVDSKNPGKPFWAVEVTVQSGDFEDRKAWTNAMLFEGALYTVVQMMKATGNESYLAKGEIPDKDKFIGKECVAVIKKQRDTYAEKRDDDGVPQWKNEIKGFKKYEGAGSVQSPAKTTTADKKKASLLP